MGRRAIDKVSKGTAATMAWRAKQDRHSEGLVDPDFDMLREGEREAIESVGAQYDQSEDFN